MADKSVSVILTTYNSAAYIEKALASLTAQSHKNLDIHVIDDASTDDTCTRVTAYSQKDQRVSLYKSKKNRGTYWCKNWLLARMTSEFVCFHDSDDWSDPDRIQVQLGAFTEPSVMAVTVRWHRVDTDGRRLTINGRRARLAVISLMIRRAPVLDTAGYFDQVRIAADTEYLWRLEKLLARGAIRKLPFKAYTGLLRPDSLTRGENSGMSWWGTVPHLSCGPVGARADYLYAAQVWHAGAQIKPLVFPQENRQFPADSGMIRQADCLEVESVIQLV